MLCFIFVLLWNSILAALSFCPHRKPIFFSKRARLCISYATPRCGHCKMVPAREGCTAQPFASKLPGAEKGGEEFITSFKVLQPLSSATWSTGGGRGKLLSPPPPLSPAPFPAPSLKSCSCVPWSKEAVILGRLHVSYSGQGEVITSSSHTAQSC